ncbi:unnamed protein product, partial [Ixodes persulcatus]
ALKKDRKKEKKEDCSILLFLSFLLFMKCVLIFRTSSLYCFYGIQLSLRQFKFLP